MTIHVQGLVGKAVPSWCLSNWERRRATCGRESMTNGVYDLQKLQNPRGCGPVGSPPSFESSCRTPISFVDPGFSERDFPHNTIAESEYFKYAMQPKSHENSNADTLQPVKQYIYTTATAMPLLGGRMEEHGNYS